MRLRSERRHDALSQVPGQTDNARVSDKSTGEPKVANVDQAAAWDGHEGEFWANHAEHFDTSTRRYDRYLIEGAHISTTDPILDVGCGCGVSTRAAASGAARQRPRNRPLEQHVGPCQSARP